jgi:hypothetical protein
MQEFWRGGLLSFVKGKYLYQEQGQDRLTCLPGGPSYCCYVMKEYGRENLSELSVEMMHTYLHDTIRRVPALGGALEY